MSINRYSHFAAFLLFIAALSTMTMWCLAAPQSAQETTTQGQTQNLSAAEKLRLLMKESTGVQKTNTVTARTQRPVFRQPSQGMPAPAAAPQSAVTPPEPGATTPQTTIAPARSTNESAKTGPNESMSVNASSAAIAIVAIILFTAAFLKRRYVMQMFLNLRIGTKLVSSFILVAFIAGIVGYVGITKLQLADESDTILYERYTSGIGLLANYSTSFHRMRSDLLNLLIANTQAVRDDFTAKISARLAEQDKWGPEIEKTNVSEESRAAFKAMTDGQATFVARIKEIEKLLGQNKSAEAMAVYKGDCEKSRTVTQEALQKLVDIKVAHAKERADLNTAEANAAIRTMIIFVILGVGGALGLGLFLARLVKRPVQELAVVAETVAGGDLTVAIAQRSTDEIGQLSGSFKRMVDSLRETLTKVGEASSAVASASSEISSSTEEMAAGAQEQTTQAGEVASAVEEMSKTILENSKNASETAETARKAKTVAEQGGLVVEETVVGMNRIADVVNKSAETVRALGKSSDQIGQIIGVIDDIADQTNLLALNAAIEAARAGEQGRGFAVVADEVRKLAERTTKATKEIAGMIKTIQIDTSEAVSSMELGTREVESGIKLADRAGISLKEIVEVSQKVTDMVGQIAAANEQQSGASEQISKNVEAISAVTGQTASGTEQIARTAEDLNRLTENLQGLLNKFTISAGGTNQQIVTAKATGRRQHLQKSHIAVRQNGALVSQEG